MKSKVYIKFDQPKSKKKLPEDGPIKKALKNIIKNALTSIIPKGNPDFENLIENVAFWKIEYDTSENTTWREIGFDKNGNAIMAMPLGENYGYWTNNILELENYNSFSPTILTREEFLKDWLEFESKYNASQQHL